jgi:hypothetical protein
MASKKLIVPQSRFDSPFVDREFFATTVDRHKIPTSTAMSGFPFEPRPFGTLHSPHPLFSRWGQSSSV